jgi:hypothetical protein
VWRQSDRDLLGRLHVITSGPMQRPRPKVVAGVTSPPLFTGFAQLDDEHFRRRPTGGFVLIRSAQERAAIPEILKRLVVHSPQTTSA